jgi:3-hydroxyisobutyrate dehydrogenase
MCDRLLDAGYSITVYDLRAESTEGPIAKGANDVSSPAELTVASDVVITIVPDPLAVEAIMNGEVGVLSALGAGQVLLEMTTSHRCSRVGSRLMLRILVRGCSMLQ